MRFKDKVALITGGTSGIGSGTAIRFAGEGAAVAITGRNTERGEQVVKEITDKGGKALFVRADVRKSDDCRNAVEQTLATFGKIDVLFNNAGVFHPKTIPECTEEEWDETIESSLRGAFLMSKFALPSMIEQGSGSIIHTSSGWGILGGDKAAAYCAAKGGLIVMAKAMAIDHGPDGMRNRQQDGSFDTEDLIVHYIGDTVTSKVRKVLKGAGMYVTGRAVHAFRHTFATETLKNNNIRVTQEALDHKDISTTQIYTHIVAEQKRKLWLRCRINTVRSLLVGLITQRSKVRILPPLQS